MIDTCVNWSSQLLSRLVQSHAEAQASFEGRVAAGTQPQITLQYTDGKFLAVANMIYLGVTFSLFTVMKNRKVGLFPDKTIKRIIMVYNAVCVALAGYVVVGISAVKLQNPGQFVCNNPAEVQDRESAEFVAWVFWVFYAQKFWEFCDTWFFLLRRSFRQVTFLHIFHHSSITIVVGTILRFDYSGDMFLPILLNALVHVLMYSHYLVTALGIKSWWRQYLTSLQLLQFCLISVQSVLAYSNGPTCGSPDWAKVVMVLYMGSMLILFGQFFVKRYINKDTQASMAGVITTKLWEPEYMVYHGVQTLDKNGAAVIDLPLSAKRLTSRPSRVNLMYQLTPVGAAMPSLYVASEVDCAAAASADTPPSFQVQGGVRGAKICWQVACERVERTLTRRKNPIPCCPQQQ